MPWCRLYRQIETGRATLEHPAVNYTHYNAILMLGNEPPSTPEEMIDGIIKTGKGSK